MTARLACKLCIATHGLRGSDIENAPANEAELIEHLEREHHIVVRRDDETDAQAYARLIAKYPEAADPNTCKCPACDMIRQMRAIQ